MRRKSANIGQYYIQRLTSRIFGESFDLDTSADNLMILDTACSHHMTRQFSLLNSTVHSTTTSPTTLQTVTMASGQTTSVTGYGKHWYLDTTLIVPTLLVNTIISGSMLDDAGYIIKIMRGTVRVLGLNRQSATDGYRNESNLYGISRLYPKNFLPIQSNDFTVTPTDTPLFFIIIMKSNQSTTISTPVINVHIDSNVNVKFSTITTLSNTDTNKNTFIMPTLDESIASDDIAIILEVSLNTPDMTLSTLNDLLTSLHL